MADLAALRTRVLTLLMDVSATIWDSDTIDAGLRLALDKYSEMIPFDQETVLTLPGDGYEIALNSLSGLIGVNAVHWPYDSTALGDDQEYNEVNSWRIYWDDAQAVLVVTTAGNDEPKEDDEIRIHWRKKQTIQDLDSEDSTSVPESHYSTLVTGAAAYAALSRVADRIDSVTDDPYLTTLLGTWGRSMERKFNGELRQLVKNWNRTGPTWEGGWVMDKFDRVY